ncbi:MAG: family 78 glycoside hydrolase catalytic domain, partial [Ignavibacteriae bacterium]|nr:family 78 glycoside hydrolase catalytic domain [Ignavibacteriota bacterium]
MEIKFKFFLTAFLIFNSTNFFAQNSLSITNLRVEYKTNSVGIDIQSPRLSWEIISDKNNTNQVAYEIFLGESEENLRSEKNLLWQVKENNSQSILIEYKGPKLNSRQKVFWKVRVWDNHNRVSEWSEIAFWEMGLLSEIEWKANWIAADFYEDTTKSNPAHYFRKSFRLENNIKSAKLYISSHGLYEAFINGKRVGDQVFTPGWTSYHKRLQYQIYDVTTLINEKENGIGVTVGDGWYRGSLVWERNRNVYGTKLALIAQLEIEYTDGRSTKIITDDSWKVSNQGPVIISDIYMGEKYDARKEFINWSNYNYEDLNFQKVSTRDFHKNILIASEGVPVRKIQEIAPINIIDKGNGKYIFDMGQNMVGWVKLKVKGPESVSIKLRHAEVLDKYGEFYTDNLRLAQQTIEYILKGKGEEIFEPHFTFQGFRFVEVTGYPGIPTKESITGIVIHSDMTPTGNFECSDSLINQLQHNIVWGLKGNFLDVPTDCPQRDERLGWTGDAQVFAPTACFNMDAAAFYSKWLKDFSADQKANGSIPDVIPDVIKNTSAGHTGWADAGVVIPWTLYLNYGDKRILEEQYESMKKWISYMQSRAGEDNLWTGDWHYGDWLAFASTSSAYMGAYTETD